MPMPPLWKMAFTLFSTQSTSDAAVGTDFSPLPSFGIKLVACSLYFPSKTFAAVCLTERKVGATGR